MTGVQTCALPIYNNNNNNNNNDIDKLYNHYSSNTALAPRDVKCALTSSEKDYCISESSLAFVSRQNIFFLVKKKTAVSLSVSLFLDVEHLQFFFQLK